MPQSSTIISSLYSNSVRFFPISLMPPRKDILMESPPLFLFFLPEAAVPCPAARLLFVCPLSEAVRPARRAAGVFSCAAPFFCSAGSLTGGATTAFAASFTLDAFAFGVSFCLASSFDLPRPLVFVEVFFCPETDFFWPVFLTVSFFLSAEVFPSESSFLPLEDLFCIVSPYVAVCTSFAGKRQRNSFY